MLDKQTRSLAFHSILVRQLDTKFLGKAENLFDQITKCCIHVTTKHAAIASEVRK